MRGNDQLDEMVRETATKANKLEDIEKLQSWTGTAQFLSAFVTEMRFFLNSSYAALAGPRHLRTQEEKVMVMEEIVADMHQLNESIKSGKEAKLQDTLNVWDKGSHNLHVDATSPE